LIISHSIYDAFLKKGLLIPQITAAFIVQPFWILLVPVPWLAYLLATRKADCSFEKVFLYFLSAGAALIGVSSILVLAAIVPWLPVAF